MTERSASCPSCGAAITFRWSAALQTTCPYCRSILVRHDVQLDRVGEVSDPLPDISPVQLGSTGWWRDRRFTVVGRIRYAHERGGWNEWHLRFVDGEGGWLSDAQLEWAISTQVDAPASLPTIEESMPGRIVTIAKKTYAVSTVTRARYVGVEGELPFEYWGKEEVPFVDLRSDRGDLATIDWSERPPIVFAGEFVSFTSLALRELRSFPGWPDAR